MHVKPFGRRPTAKPPTVQKPHNAGYPAKNLGQHLKAPTSGEIVTEHRWADRKAK